MEHIDYELPPGPGKMYVRIPFEVPEDIEYLILSGSYAVEGLGGADIGLEDAAAQIRGWSGNLNRIEEIFLGAEQASYGYLAGPLQPGTWHIVLGDRQAHAEPIHVELCLELLPQHRRIVRGDIHGHSYYSDGTHSIEEKLEMARQQNLDFLGFTDHNSVAQNFHLPINPDVLLLSSCEITTYNGHVNIFGYHQASIPHFMHSNSAEVCRQLEELKSEGVWLQLNHPIRKGDEVGCQWNWSYDMPFDWIEVWNGTWNDNCVANLELWQGLLQEGRFLPAVANSDFHCEGSKVQGYPCNNVWVGKKTGAEIFSALAKGHNYMTASPLAETSFAATCHNSTGFVPFGSTVVGTELTLCLETALEFVKELTASGTLLLRAWNERGLHQELALSWRDFFPLAEGPSASGQAHYKLEINGANNRFLRFELLQKGRCGEEMLLLSNPVFFS